MKIYSLVSTFIFVSMCLNAHAQPSALDAAFADNGVGVYSIPLQNTLTSAKCAMQQPDGKIILGVRMDGFAALVRLNTDGSLDNSFGGDGKILYTGSSSVLFSDGLIQPDGKIVVTGYSGDQTLILRFRANGSPDNNFDGDGEVLVDFGSDSYGRSVAIQPDGKIVVAGYVYNSPHHSYSIIRLNSDGTPDINFADGAGKRQFNINAGMKDIANSVFIQSTGKILMAGVSYNGSDYDVSAARLKADGSFDETFSGDGKLILQLQSAANDIAVSIAETPAGKIVIGGYTGSDENNDFALVRLNDDGSFDNNFDGDGKTIIPVGTNDDVASEMAIQPDGKILLGGSSYTSNLSYEYSVIRVRINGTPDQNFNADGKKIISFTNSADFCYCMLLLSDGKIFLAGASGNPAALTGIAVYQNFSAAQLNSNGNIDISFDGDGKKIYPTGSYADAANTAGIDVDGNIIIAGASYLNSETTIASVIKLRQNGITDNQFDTDGKLLFNTGVFFTINAIEVQPNGKILFAGVTSRLVDTSFLAGRLNNDGTPDISFGNDGTIAIPVSGTSVATCITRQDNGKILVGGHSTRFNGTKDFTVIRLLPSGVLDNTFDGDGIKTIPFFASGVAYAIAVQPNGKILLAGNAQTIVKSNPSDFAVTRLNTDGSIDNSFGSSGKAIINLGKIDNCYAMKLQPDGKIVVGGASNNGTSFDFAVARLSTSGGLDKTFDKDGMKVIPVGTSDDIAKGLAIQTDGKIILGGYSLNGADYDACAVRITGTGSLDNSFDNDHGKKVYSMAGTDEIINAVNLQADGKILLSGKQKPVKEKYGSSFFALRLRGNSTATVMENHAVITGKKNSLTLQQNIPNPFINSTTINYTLPQTYTSAKIIIVDKNGKTLKAITISGSGKGNLNVDASTLASGTYQYSLIVDGRLIATKQMILIK